MSFFLEEGLSVCYFVCGGNNVILKISYVSLIHGFPHVELAVRVLCELAGGMLFRELNVGICLSSVEY